MANPSTANEGVHSRGFFLFLVFTAFACGSMIMVVEVLGSRVIGPFFGVSLFVWTSLIAVTMISLATGYALGGVLSDRWEDPDYLYGPILLAGVAVMLIPLLKGPVIKLSMSFGLRAGAFASSMLLFGPSLILLGCVSPYLIKIVAREFRSIGRTVGAFYAVSTIGSVFGTIMSGFVLIAYVGVDNIFFIVGSFLVLIAIVFFAFFRSSRVALVLLFLLVVPFLGGRKEAISKVMPNGIRVELVDHEETYYGSIKIVDYRYGPRHHRELIIDGLVQGGLDMVTRQPFYPYPYLLEYLPRQINPEGGRCLVVGVGAGIIPAWYEEQGVATDVVDIDAYVVGMAERHFGFKVIGQKYIEDARYFLGRNKEKYDYVILDVFNGDTTPSHVVSLESFRMIRNNLVDRGVLGINLAANIKGNNLISASVVKTLYEVFDNVDIFPNFDPMKESEGNLTLLAYSGDRVDFHSSLFDGVPVHPFAAEMIGNFDKYQFSFPEETPAIVLTDNFNPMDTYDLALKERTRLAIIQNTDWDILLR